MTDIQPLMHNVRDDVWREATQRLLVVSSALHDMGHVRLSSEVASAVAILCGDYTVHPTRWTE